MKKLNVLKSTVTILAMVALVATATGAYFSDTDTSSANTFATGTLRINIDQSMQTTINPVISNWYPGGETTVRFNIQNTGTLPVNLAAYALGSWGVYGLDDSLVKVTKVEYWDAGAWHTIKEDLTGIAGIVYYSPTGDNVNLWTLPGAATEEFRLTVKFDESADNTYQNKTYTATLHAGAKQVNGPSFPSF